MVSLAGRLTQELADAQRASHSAVDPWRKRETTLPDDNRFFTKVRQERAGCEYKETWSKWWKKDTRSLTARAEALRKMKQRARRKRGS